MRQAAHGQRSEQPLPCQHAKAALADGPQQAREDTTSLCLGVKPVKGAPRTSQQGWGKVQVAAEELHLLPKPFGQPEWHKRFVDVQSQSLLGEQHGGREGT